MGVRDIVQICELDIDFCTRTFGNAPCLASLGAGTPRKCYNTFSTCSYKQAYNKGTLTLKFIEGSHPVKGDNYIPALKSVSGREQEINIAGFTPNVGALGQRASVTVKFSDFPTRDVLTDKYWQERMSGAAQVDEAGYDPLSRGSFWQKYRARTPNFAGRSLRVVQAYYSDSGTIIYDKIRYYVVSEFSGPDSSGDYTITAKDVLSLADDKNAQAPKQVRGVLLADIDATQTTAVLTPAGIGNLEYPAQGFATIGSEIVSFFRTGDSMTLTRGMKGTQAATHSANDSFQPCFNVTNVRADAVIRDLLVNYANIPAVYIPYTDWQSEFTRWGSKMVLNATICKPTGVAELLKEINQLGITMWWDEIGQRIRIKLNHPNEEAPKQISDAASVMNIVRQDNDDERATRVAFWAVQIDPTKALAQDNFIRQYLAIFVDGENPNMYGKPTVKTIYTRWMNQGNDAAIKIIAGRLLTRYKVAPVTYQVTLDAKDDMSLADTVELTSYANSDITGKPETTMNQVYYRKDDKSGSTLQVRLQRFLFDARYGYIAENSRPRYNASSPAQKIRGSYFVGPTLQFSDGAPPYQFI